ncbi:MAG TPA: hypothetical protein VGU26_06545 [Gaiellaceae bacterium]|nr:hypothetical protein [Gaiellaceae bacterium]
MVRAFEFALQVGRQLLHLAGERRERWLLRIPGVVESYPCRAPQPFRSRSPCFIRRRGAAPGTPARVAALALRG